MFNTTAKSRDLFIVLFTISTATWALPSFASWKVSTVKTPSGTRVLSVHHSRQPVAHGQKVLIQRLPRLLGESFASRGEIYEEYIADDAALPPAMKALAVKGTPAMLPRSVKGDVRTIVNQGPVDNRINLTIVGDGYTAGDREKFFTDALSTTKQLFEGQTFASYLPLFNVHAVFVASAESGIGDGEPKNTALKLYRSPKGSKRAIMPGDEAAAEAAIALAPGADFPILLANDNYYGGLGGRYAISTSSPRSGIIVLRHELGHNFGNVGEEYDGGEVYAGANYSSSTNVPWKHWVESDFKINNAVNLGGQYVWQNLFNKPFSFNFNFPTGDMLFQVLISTVGWETPDDVETSIDHHKITLKGEFNEDRHFYDIGPGKGLPAGNHALRFEEKVHDGDNVLAFARLYAYPQDYDFTKNKIGAYLSYNSAGQKVGYRPTHDSCPMRNMLNPNFCVVDKENMWIRFLNRVSLVDGVEVTPGRQVKLHAPALTGLKIAWFKLQGGQYVEIDTLRDQAVWQASATTTGKFKVKVQFTTPEVRKYTPRFVADKDFIL